MPRTVAPVRALAVRNRNDDEEHAPASNKEEKADDVELPEGRDGLLPKCALVAAGGPCQLSLCLRLGLTHADAQGEHDGRRQDRHEYREHA